METAMGTCWCWRRAFDHLRIFYICFSIGADLVTVPATVLTRWAEASFPMPDERFTYTPTGRRIDYEELTLDRSWRSFNIEHELTTKGVETFAADYRATLYSKASQEQ